MASVITRGVVLLSRESLEILCVFLHRTSECTFQIGPILIVDEPLTVTFEFQEIYRRFSSTDVDACLSKTALCFQIDSGLMTPTMKIRRDRVVALYKDQISELYN